MLDFGWSQMLLIAAVALVVLGPKELPRVIKNVTEWVGKARSLAREFRSSVDEMIRETELHNLKEEFESAARKAESEFNQTIEAEAVPLDGSESAIGRSLPDLYDDGSQAIKLQPLMDHQRKKKPAKRAARPVYKPRVLARPESRTGASAVRRKARL
jgi:sec-independent protein translocase protein TatB